MKNVLHKKGWHTDSVQIYVELTPFLLLKIKNGTKVEKGFVKIKLLIDTMSENSD